MAACQRCGSVDLMLDVPCIFPVFFRRRPVSGAQEQ